jgi:hypothetical protein
MSTLSYVIVPILCQILASVPMGTNRGLFVLLWALLSGRFLPTRGAVFPALSALGLTPAEVRRSEAALAYGQFQSADLFANWQTYVQKQGEFQPQEHEGIRPVAADLTGFYRPHLKRCTTKHFSTQAGKALPALVYGLGVSVGCVGKMRLGIPRMILRQQPAESEMALQTRLVKEIGAKLRANEALVVDAGFSLWDLRQIENASFVVRMPQNASARRNVLPTYCGKGTHPKWGVLVRPLPRTYARNPVSATPADLEFCWKEGPVLVRAYLYDNLVAANEHPGAKGYRLIVILHPHYSKPLLLATNLLVSVQAVYHLYKDRWPVEQLPLSAKQILGAERSFVSSDEARYRLPELALLAGNILSYVAATGPAVATGFWDRCCRPTCGRLRRSLERVHFSNLSLPQEQIRTKASITEHLPKGVIGHRRQKAQQQPAPMPAAA